MSLAACALILVQTVWAADVVVIATPPLDGERLADALRAYLPEYGVRVEDNDAAARRGPGREAWRAGAGHREVVAVVRAQQVTATRIELTVLDPSTTQTVLATLSRPGRDEDLYRAIALKTYALVHATVSEAPRVATTVAPRSLGGLPTARSEPATALAVAHASTEGSFPQPARFSFQTGYVAMKFPLGGPSVEGISLAGMFALRPWLELALAGAALSAVSAQEGDVNLVASFIPVTASLRAHLLRRWYELLVGPAVELAMASVAASAYAQTPVRPSTRSLMLGLGAEAEGRLRLGSSFWIYCRGSALGVLLGQRYTLNHQSVLDFSRFQVAGWVGIGFALR